MSVPRIPAAGDLSAELFAIPLDGHAFLVYAPLRRAAFIGNNRVIEVLEDLRRGLGQAGTESDPLLDLLRNLGMIGAGQEMPPTFTCEGEPEPVAVTLLLTTACNLRCTYCYAAAGDGEPAFMSLETAQRGIDFVIANAARRKSSCIELGYHGGGEPTVNWAVLTGSYEYARGKAAGLNLELRGSLATNGVLDDRQIDWVAANLKGVSLSCDGPPEINDSCRRTAAGKGSSARVLRTLKRFDAAGFQYGIRLTVTAEHIRVLADSVDYLLSEFHPYGIQVEPVYLLGRGADAMPAESEAFLAAYRAAGDRARARGGRISFSGARAGTLTNHFCGVSHDNFCLSPAGNVTACFEAFSEEAPFAGEFYYGRPAAGGAGYVMDHAVLSRLRAQVVETREHCRECFAKWSCAGDCYYKWLVGSGGGAFHGSARCHIIRELTKDQILEKIADAGGLFWHEPAREPPSEA